MLRRLGSWALVALVVFFVVKHPAPAAHAVKTFVGGVGAFFTYLIA